MPMPSYDRIDPRPAAGFRWTQPGPGVGCVLRCEPLAGHARHLFTSRDLELRGKDAEWQAVGDVFGVPLLQIRLVKQVHRADVAIVRRGDV